MAEDFDHIYVYGTGERPDGMRFAVHTMTEAVPGPTPCIALFRDKEDAHLFAHAKAPSGGQVIILPSAE